MDLVFTTRRFRFAMSTGVSDDDDEFVDNTGGNFEIAEEDAVSPSQVRDTLLHEILHAALNDTPISVEDEESLVRALSPMLLEIIRANPHVVRFLREGADG